MPSTAVYETEISRGEEKVRVHMNVAPRSTMNTNGVNVWNKNKIIQSQTEVSNNIVFSCVFAWFYSSGPEIQFREISPEKWASNRSIDKQIAPLICCDDHASLSSTTAVQIWIISYKLHTISLHGKIWTQ